MVDLIPPYRSPSPSTSRVLVALPLHLKFRSASLPPYRGPPPLHLKSWPAPLAACRSPPLDLKCPGWPPLPPQVLAGPAPHLPQVQVGVTPSLLVTVPTGCPSTSGLPASHPAYRSPSPRPQVSWSASLLDLKSRSTSPSTSSPGRSLSSPTATPISSPGRPPSLPPSPVLVRGIARSSVLVGLPLRSRVLVGLPLHLKFWTASLPTYLKLWPAFLPTSSWYAVSPAQDLDSVASPSSPRLPRLVFLACPRLAFFASSSSPSSPSPLRLARRPPVP
ncbi:hypothetical protein CF326_g5405 [Tilletia indica]|nr:hypothetical protein CF326_g5405 [Tilletia indica]